tara:strand:- start:58 stop:396 length:339 start_codon:yes stop_codon:yes gene_type:complete
MLMKILSKSLFFISCFSFLSAANFFFISTANAKDYKPYLCNFRVGVLENPNVGSQGDPCMEKGESPVKFYLKKFSYKNKDKCIDDIEKATSTPEMLKEYPANDWMVGCDKRW